MNATQHKSWLWPDRTIGKAESRQLREEHNALVNSHHELLEAATAFLADFEAYTDNDDYDLPDTGALEAAIARAAGAAD